MGQGVMIITGEVRCPTVDAVKGGLPQLAKCSGLQEDELPSQLLRRIRAENVVSEGRRDSMLNLLQASWAWSE